MTESSVITLPPIASSAFTARRIIESALAGSDAAGWLDEALLLATELVTNAILHAGTDLDMHLDVSPARLRVEVVDKTPGPLNVAVRAAPAETSESGRGLLLIDALATEWGTRHFANGKSVWFTLGDAEKAPERRPLERAPREPPRRDIAWLVDMPVELEQELNPAQLIEELLFRLCGALRLARCWVYAQSAEDEREWTVIAATDATHPAPEAESVRRAARAASAATTPGDHGVIFPLRNSSGVFAALLVDDDPGAPVDDGPGADGVLDPDGDLEADGGLDPDDLALARLVGQRIGVILRDDRARAAQLRSRGSLALLAEASEMFAGTLDVQLAMTLATQLVVPRFARWSAVWDTRERVPQLMAVAHSEESRLSTLQAVFSSPDGELLATRLASHLDERRPNLLPGSELPTELTEERPGDVLALPLVARRRLVGLLIVGRPADGAFGADDVSLLNDLGRRTAVAVDSARLYEDSTAVAQALQAWLLPPSLPTSKVAQFAARYAAAGEGNEVGGDFYDVFELTEEGWGFAIGDVCGKGPEAAAITGMTRDVLRLLVRDRQRPPTALRRLNDAILELGERGRFCTAMLGIARPDGDRLQVSFSIAGHPLPVLARADGSARFVGRSGTLLGVLDDVDLGEDLVVLEPGDALVCYTDGVTERRNGDEMFGDRQLLECLRHSAGLSADGIADLLEEQVQRFGVARDDLAVLVVRCADSVPAG